MPRVSLVTGPVSTEWHGLTYPSYRPFLTGEYPEILVAAARVWGRPAGLGVVRIERDVAELLSLHVSPEWRRQGIGTDIWKCLATTLRENSVRRTTATIVPQDEVVLQRFCARAGWSAPTPHMHLIFGDLERVGKVQCFRKIRSMPGLEMFPWSALTPAERRSIEARQAAGEVPESLDPFIDEPLMEPSTSLGVRQEGTVIGWQVNHRIAHEMHRFTATWVARVPGSTRIALWLMGETRARYLASKIPHMVLGVMAGNDAMREFVTDRFYPYASAVRTTYSTTFSFD